MVYEDGQVNLVDIGFVGTVDKINTDLLNLLIQNDYIPRHCADWSCADGETYNINADSVPVKWQGLKAEKLLMLTDVRGIYEDHHDESTFLSTLTFEKAHELIIKGSIDGGMIPKVKACITALSGGAHKTHIIDGAGNTPSFRKSSPMRVLVRKSLRLMRGSKHEYKRNHCNDGSTLPSRLRPFSHCH